jgi:hypothetical protein
MDTDMTIMQGIPGKSDNDDMMIRF